MASNVLMKTLLRSVMPSVQKFVDGGKIDTLFQELKSKYNDSRRNDAASVEILITTEADGNEYVNIVELEPDLRVSQVMEQQRLSELITTLLTQSEI